MKLQLCSSPLAYLLMFSILLTVTGEKQLPVTQPEMVKAEAGESVAITCSFTFNVPAYSVTWTFECNSSVELKDLPCFKRRVNISSPDLGLTPKGPHGEPNYEVNATITIINLTEDDSGTFCCHVKALSKTGSGLGTRLEVTPRSIPEDQPEDQGQEQEQEKYILYTVIGAEAFVIIILIAVVIKCRLRGLSRSEDQGLQSDPSELQYADICKKSNPQHSRPRINVQEVTYSAVKIKKEEQEYDLY